MKLKDEKVALKEQWQTSTPSSHLVVAEFIDTKTVMGLLKSLSTVEFTLKESDLFTFLQTADLNDSENEAIVAMKEFLLSSPVVRGLERITGKKLGDKIDLHATIFQDTHHLLCHDDQISGRALAFMIYLTDMTPESGGQLQLFDKDKRKPTEVSVSIVPKSGTLAVLGVGDASWHAVSEVTEDRQRIALAGWYHEQ